MKKLVLFLISLLSSLASYAQKEEIAAAIVGEGKKIYRSETASRYSNDLFLKKYSYGHENIGGHFSYADGDLTKCVFFSNDQEPKVICAITFDSTLNISKAIEERSTREFTSVEKEFYLVQQNAWRIINSDSLFKTYQGTIVNLIPLNDSKGKRVFIMTESKRESLIAVGNDYLLTFDKENNLTGKKQLHRGLIAFDLKSGTKHGAKQKGGMHTHSNEDFITATDICSLLLYRDYTGWELYYVVSKKYISIWNCKTENLQIMTIKAFKKILKNVEKTEHIQVLTREGWEMILKDLKKRK
jgi:hypothetical protein